MRRIENYIRKYGPEFGPKLYHALQSQAAHAGVSARLRKKLAALSESGKSSPRHRGQSSEVQDLLPLFPEEKVEAVGSMAAIAS